MELEKARPPYVTFESRPVEDREHFVEGEPVKYKDCHYAFITPVGSKDRIERVVKDWFDNLKEQIKQGRFDPAWLASYEAAYNAWKNDQEPPVNGTSIRLWPILSPAQVKSLVALRVLAVEDLAAANEETLTRIGMGARALQDQAKKWLASQEKDGLSTLIKQNQQLMQQLERVLDRNKELERGNAELKALAAEANA